jgi:hypothetical protein
VEITSARRQPGPGRRGSRQRDHDHQQATSPPATPKMGVRVALYLRISTDEEHQPFSLE